MRVHCGYGELVADACTSGRSIAFAGQLIDVLHDLLGCLLGWKAYFGLAQTPRVWRKLHQWLRHRLRAIQLKHWKRSAAIYRGLKALGATDAVAQKVAGNSRCW